MREKRVRTWLSGQAGKPEKFRKLQTLKEFIGEYAAWMGQMNYALDTISERRRSLLLVAEWCEDRGVRLLTQVTAELVERYPKHLFQQKNDRNQMRRSFNTQRCHLTAVREFFRWCYRKKHLNFNPASEIELPRSERRLPRTVLNPQQVEQVMAVVDLNEPEGIRDRVILETLYSTGIRRQELANLSIYDVNLSHGTVMVRLGKGKKDRLVPIGERAIRWIEKYIAEARPMLVKGHDPQSLFLNSDGEPCTASNLSTWVRKYVQMSGVAPQGACHLFRHAMATAMLDQGADLRFIQKMLGHASLESTQLYTHVSLQKLKEVHSAYHPGANLRESGKKGKKKAA
jgi:integrase/recombinase XerD